MAANKKNNVIAQLRPWIQSLKFNAEENRWEGSLKPQGAIVIRFELLDWITALERHVITELIEVCADVLSVNPEQIQKYTRNRDITDLRAVVAIIVMDHFQAIRQESINDLLGWRNRCSFANAFKQAEVREVQQKLDKVYRAYPSLRKGLIEIVSPAESVG